MDKNHASVEVLCPVAENLGLCGMWRWFVGWFPTFRSNTLSLSSRIK